MSSLVTLKVIGLLLMPELHQESNFCKYPPNYSQITKQFNEHIPLSINIEEYDMNKNNKGWGLVSKVLIIPVGTFYYKPLFEQ